MHSIVLYEVLFGTYSAGAKVSAFAPAEYVRLPSATQSKKNSIKNDSSSMMRKNSDGGGFLCSWNLKIFLLKGRKFLSV